jgi:hypothetical protein
MPSSQILRLLGLFNSSISFPVKIICFRSGPLSQPAPMQSGGAISDHGSLKSDMGLGGRDLEATIRRGKSVAFVPYPSVHRWVISEL